MARSTTHDWFSFRRAFSRQPQLERQSKRLPFRRQLRVEPLEGRRLLSITVNTLGDTVNFNDGVTSLREAVFAANLVGGADTIDFEPSLTSGGPAAILLTMGELAIADSLTINGPGTNLLTIDASGNDPTPNLNNGDGSRVFNIDDGIATNVFNVSISGLTLAGGDVSGIGGAIRSQESLTLVACTISDNSAGVGGGGIHSSGGGPLFRNALTLTESTIRHNSAEGPGAGVFADYCNVSLSASTISGNETTLASGGGIFSNSSGLTVVQSTISENAAPLGFGGGIVSFGSGTLTVSYSTISDNSAGSNAGGIYVFSEISSAELRHTIVAGNTLSAGTTPFDVAGHVALRFSLIGVDTGVLIADNGGNLIGTAAAPIDPLLGPLAKNGGPTYTRALLAGSPAINAGDLAAVAGVGGVPEFDQRGAPFGRVFHSRIDIGAFEYQAASDLNLVVDTLSDESDGNYWLGDLSLREAIILANTYASSDTIRFAPALVASGPATLLLTMGELKVTDNTSIIGLGDELLTIDASGNDPTPNSSLVDGITTNDGDGSRIFNIDNVSSAIVLDISISGLTLTGGDANGNGGAIQSLENLSLTDVTLRGNSTTAGNAFGGGIYSNFGSLTVTDSMIHDNSAMRFGGGIYKIGSGSLTVTNSIISANSALAGSGGGIRSQSSLTVTESTITGNSAAISGGGIYQSGSGSLTVTNSTISANSALGGSGGGIRTTSSLTLTASTISNNSAIGSGGGVQAGGQSNVTNSTITGNSATGSGGGMSAYGATVSGSTFSGNSAGGSGGGKSGGGTITNSTFSGNSAGGSGGGISGGGTITNSTFIGNSARDGGGISGGGSIMGSTIRNNTAERNGGGILNSYGALTLTRTTIENNKAGLGAGVFHGGGELAVVDSTLAANAASGNGGALVARGGGKATVANSTISGNTAGGSAGGLYLLGTYAAAFTIRHSTIASNTAGGMGGGIFLLAGPLSLDHTILAANSGLVGPDLADPVSLPVGVHFSLIGTNAGSPLVEAPLGAPDANGNLIGGVIGGVINPMLGLLTDNGGTPTRALLPGSPAIDAGDATTVSGVGSVPVNDQRGEPFARVFGGRIDIGAYERQTLAELNLVVDTLADEVNGDYSAGDLSLREAIGLANGGLSSLDTISFAPALTANGPATILLTRGELAITDSTTIVGPGRDLLTIDASGNDLTPTQKNGDGSRVFNIDDGTSALTAVSISGLTLTGGDVAGLSFTDGGGAIRTFDNLTVIGSTIRDNSATYGGGIRNVSGNLVITGSTIEANLARNDGGGGISNTSYATVIINNSTISGNATSGDGGAIRLAYGSLILTGSTLSGNSANVDGGAISGGANLTITNSTLSGNSAKGYGGGIWGATNAIISIVGSTISGNSAARQGGGIDAFRGSLTMIDSTMNGNSAGSDGGAIATNGDVTLRRSSISGNIAGGSGGGILKGVVNNIYTPYGSRLKMYDSTISNNRAALAGGGITTGTADMIINSTISGNSAGTDGGGIRKPTTITIIIDGSTVSGNSATGSGGGLSTPGNFIVSSSTVAGNSAGSNGGGLSVSNSATKLVTYSIVANNTRGLVATPSDVAGSVTVLYALLGVDTGATISFHALETGGSLIGTAAAPIDPRLGPLANNGGPTMTHALLAGSPAINAGSPSAMAGVSGIPLYDQRGNPFSRVFGGRIDIGAFELQPPVLLGDYNENGVVDAADYTVWRNVLTAGSTSLPNDPTPGTVDRDDYLYWRGHFGEKLPLGAGSGEISGSAVMQPVAARSGSAAVAFIDPAFQVGNAVVQTTEDTTSSSVEIEVERPRMSALALLDGRSARHNSAFRPQSRINGRHVALPTADNLLLLLANNRVASFSPRSGTMVENHSSINHCGDDLEVQTYIDEPLAMALADWR